MKRINLFDILDEPGGIVRGAELLGCTHGNASSIRCGRRRVSLAAHERAAAVLGAEYDMVSTAAESRRRVAAFKSGLQTVNKGGGRVKCEDCGAVLACARCGDDTEGR